MNRFTILLIVTVPFWGPVFLIGLLAAVSARVLECVADVIACSLIWVANRLEAFDEPKEVQK